MSSRNEQDILEELGATQQEQDAYEEQVIREAQHQWAPSLTGVGFPDLSGLGAIDAWHVHQVLARVRQPATTNNEREVRGMQEQILLTYLQHVAGIAHEDLPVDPTREVQEEQRRAQMCRRQPSSSQETISRETVGMLPRRANRQPRAVEPEIQVTVRPAKRPRLENTPLQRKQQLQALRLQRIQRQEERRREEETKENATSDEEVEFADNDGDEERSDNISTGILVECPLCNASISAPKDNVDATLSQHMDICQRERPRRSRRGIDTTNLHPKASPMKATKHRHRTYGATPAIDDYDELDYEDRVDDWIKNGVSRMKEMKERDLDEEAPGEQEYDGGLYIPAWVNNRLFGYQRVGVKWMWKLHREEAGGVVGDQMGLGKTVQVCSFLGALAASRQMKCALVVAPATMLQHWLNELAVWAPGLRRVLIHLSADGVARQITPSLLMKLSQWLKRCRRDRVNEVIDEEDWDNTEHHAFCGTGYAIVTTYENLRRNPEVYTAHKWSYIVLDEAQKIRNPDADVTLACKRIRTPHRIAMTGTPIQNDLKELWSIYDFVFPGRLGTLPTFEQEFADPIKRGGYSNASPMQVQLAYRCALVLKDLINPYLLRREKKDVKEVNRMPGKTEHVLFCRLSDRQRDLYKAFLRSDEVSRVMSGNNQLFAAITMLRKICNHPDLVCDPDNASFQTFVQNAGIVSPMGVDDESDLEEDYSGDGSSLVSRAGKLEVLARILPLWYEQGHRVLIFCQWTKMLNIIQRFVSLKGWRFGRLDGNTNVASRQRLVDQFNEDKSIFCMLCTTRTGGVGLNLTGANRIILYDPDWNPQTDAQARERAWRFGQEREVTIYRLITAGTVEEKIYQRQIFKTALSNKVLQDPRQRRLFSQRDLRDLFSLRSDSTVSSKDTGSGITETGLATKGGGVLDPYEEGGINTEDNQATLEVVLKSKGLAGVFDHNFLERDSSVASCTAKELEEKARQVAKKAEQALAASVASQIGRYEPTWTGAQGARTNMRFGSTVVGGTVSSSTLLANLRQKQAAAKTNESAINTDEYASLLQRIRDFVRRRRPTTEEIMKEFDNLPDCDVAIFRQLLRSVASLADGRWILSAAKRI